jgi:3-dehydroquinate dehydratase/shikimate dehydrogenase
MGARLVVTVMPRTRELTAGALAHPPAGADYVELRLDALPEPSPRAVKALLDLPRSIPVIATCRPTGPLDDAARLALLSAAGEAGAELLDVEDTLLPQLPASVPGERLASGHVARFVPRLSALARRVAGHGTPLAKLAVPADTPRQLRDLLALQEEQPEHVAIVPTGRLAEAGRVLIAGRGAALCYGALDAADPGHADQPTAARLHGIFSVGTVGPATRFAAVVARPVAHSLSPAYHNSVFHDAGLDRRMLAMDVDSLQDLLACADALRLDGFAVSQPFKRDALALAASALPGAQSTGAANTLLRTPAGWQARNTDWKAACDLLPGLIKRWRKSHHDAAPRALLLGSGGAARAMAVALLDTGVELHVWSRRLANARLLTEALADVLPSHPAADPDEAPADLVINATPVGSPGADPGELGLSAAAFRAGALAVDLAYGAAPSPFRDAARAAGAHLTTGEDFFCLQARRQSEVFLGGPLPPGAHDRATERCRAGAIERTTAGVDAIG